MSVARLLRWYERFAAALAAVAAVLILAMSICTTYDVLARYFFNIDSPWAFDLTEYSLVWVTFLGAPWVLLQDRHIRIEVLVEVLPPKVQRVLGIVTTLVALAACAVLVWKTGSAAIQYYTTGVEMPRIWRIPKVWPYIILPIGSVLLCISCVARLTIYLTRDDPESVLRAKASSWQEAGGSPESGDL